MGNGFDFNKMNDEYYDVLREIGNIGAGNATTALSQLLNERIDMSVPKVSMLDFSELPDVLGGAETSVVGIMLSLSMDINGMMLFIIEEESAKYMVSNLMQCPPSEDGSFSDMDKSALCEVGNIICGAYLYSLGQLTGMTINASVPSISIDMAGAILSVPAIEFGKMGDKALFIQSKFGEIDREINGYFILIPNIESYGKILNRLGFTDIT